MKKVLVEILPRKFFNENEINDTKQEREKLDDPKHQIPRRWHDTWWWKRSLKSQDKAPKHTLRNKVLYKTGIPVTMACMFEQKRIWICHHGNTWRDSWSPCRPTNDTQKIAKLSFYCPTMYRDTEHTISKCEKCQQHASIPRLWAITLVSVTKPLAFHDVWC